MSDHAQTLLEKPAEAPPEAFQSLRAVLDAHRDERHAIVLRNFPDPDAISSGLAHQLISAAFNISTDLLYSGKISHPQNLALVKVLGIELIRFDETVNLESYDGAICVDHQGTAAEDILQALEAAQVPIVAVIDHHEPQDRVTAEFSDIRRTGATASIYANYLEQGLLELDKARTEHVLAATALLHGILTDTDGFIRANTDDLRAVSFLSRFRDAEVLKQIMSQSRSKLTMDVIRRALGNRLIVESFSVAGIGYLRAQDRDAIPQAADFLLTEENVHTAIVYGIVVGEDHTETLIGSMRTSKFTLEPDEFIKNVFGKNAAGRYYGGGKISAGGFEIPIEFLAGEHSDEFRERKWQVYDSQIKHKIFTMLGVDRGASAGVAPGDATA
jgi:nanoRNase/pAp phosphatase (c-di-AMP/oligoRNAs hydrolase)